MAHLYYKKPILQPDSHEIKQTFLHGPRPGHSSLLPEPQRHREPDLPPEQRKTKERNFAMQTTNHPIRSWSWDKTGKYVYNKDVLMVAYLRDFPIVDWIIPYQVARYTYEAFLPRGSLRGRGLSVCEKHTAYSWWIRGEPAPIDFAMSTRHENEAVEEEKQDMGVEEMQDETKFEQGPVKPELLHASHVSQTEVSTAGEESKDQKIEQDDANEEGKGTIKESVKPALRRSMRTFGKKIEEESKRAEEEEKPINLKPHTLHKKQPSTEPKRSKGKKAIDFGQETDEPSPRRFTRVAAKRKFADEPWTSPTKKKKKK